MVLADILKPIEVDPLIVVSSLFAAISVGFGWYIVRLDTMVEDLRKEIVAMMKAIGALQNADVSCTREQDIILRDMTHIRSTLLKMVSRRFMRNSLREEWKADKREKRRMKKMARHRELSASERVQHGHIGEDTHV